MPKLLPAIALLCLSTAACTQSFSPGRTPTAYDGTYGGMTVASHTSANTCGKMTPVQVKYVVQNGSVVWKPVPGATIYAPIMKDGGFFATYNASFGSPAYISGRVTPTGMMARSDDGNCHMVLDLKRQST